MDDEMQKSPEINFPQQSSMMNSAKEPYDEWISDEWGICEK